MDSNVDKVKKSQKKTKEKTKWLKSRMWFSTFLSALFDDLGAIPPNIGNNLIVQNNMYVTKNSLNTVILVKELSNKTPVAMTSELIDTVKDVSNACIDFSLLNRKYFINPNDSGLRARIDTWEKSLNNPFLSEKTVTRAARCLYTVDVLNTGVQFYKTRFYITVRTQTGTEMGMALQKIKSYFHTIGADYKIIKSDLNEHLEYIATVSDKVPKNVKDIRYTVQTQQTLAEILPMNQGMNDLDGVFMGLDVFNNAPYFIDFRKSSGAKNIYVAAKSGYGKTFLVINWLLDMYSRRYNLCIMDIKGNEFDKMVKALGGLILSMRNNSKQYINYFKWLKSEVVDGEYDLYASDRFRKARDLIVAICDFGERNLSKGESLIEEFLQSYYTSLGVLRDNPNTWYLTERITPNDLFIGFYNYLSVEIKRKYGALTDDALDRIKIYFSREGSKSHMFTEEYTYDDIHNSNILLFDFGILEDTGYQDPVTFKIHVMFMRDIMTEFIAEKKRRKEWTGVVMEESQIVPDYVIEVYSEMITLGRSRNQVNMILGNSIETLMDNPASKAIVDNLNILCFGVLTREARYYVTKKIGLSDENSEKLEEISTNPQYENTFLLINQMQKGATTPLLKAYVPERVRRGQIFNVVDEEH